MRIQLEFVTRSNFSSLYILVARLMNLRLTSLNLFRHCWYQRNKVNYSVSLSEKRKRQHVLTLAYITRLLFEESDHLSWTLSWFSCSTILVSNVSSQFQIEFTTECFKRINMANTYLSPISCQIFTVNGDNN